MPSEVTSAAVNLRLALIGLAVPVQAEEETSAQLVAPILARQRELSRRLSDRLCAADQRIQTFLDDYLADVYPGDMAADRPMLPRRTLVLDEPGLARAISLPVNGDSFSSPLLSSYRLANGVLHNPANDRRTTAGVFHIAEGGLPPGSVYTIGTDAADNRLAMFLIQTQMNRGSGRIVPLGNLSSKMKEAIKTADAYLKANLKNLGIDQDLKAYDFTVQAINLNQAKEGAETAVAFFLSMVSALLGKPILDRTVVLGEMSVQGMLLKVSALPERMQAAVEAGAKRILIPSENKRDLAEVPDAILTAIQWQFYDSPTRAAILAMGMG
mgnify:CR=1 FL=1